MPNPLDQFPLPLYQVLEEEYERLHGQLPPSRNAPPAAGQAGLPASEARLAAVFKEIHAKKHSALCLSGGGIRSATFALGILQGLARNNLIDKFSYLSTVSGGGYVGGWLSAWIHRHPKGAAGIIEELQKEPTTKLEPEPEPIQHLRSYSNYLTPRLGLFSADTWTLAAIILRNLILNWLVLIPLLIVVLAIPRLSVATIHNLPSGSWTWYAVVIVLTFFLLVFLLVTLKKDTALKLSGKLLFGVVLAVLAFAGAAVALWMFPLPTTLILGFAGGVTCITYVGIKRPSSTVDYNDQGGFLMWCLLPLLASAVSLTTFWAWFRLSNLTTVFPGKGWTLPAWLSFLQTDNEHSPVPFIAFGVLLYMTGWLFYSVWLGRAWWHARSHLRKAAEFFAMLFSGAIGGVFLWLVATKVFYEPISYHDYGILYYVSFAAPFYLVLFLATAILFAGISSEITEDEDREWWARFSAWVLIAIVAWTAVSYLTLLGPLLLQKIGAAYVVPAGGLIGLLTTKLAQSAKSPANIKQEEKTGWRAVLMSYTLPLGSLLFVALLIVLLSILINYLLAILTFIFAPLTVSGIFGWFLNQNWLLRHANGGRAIDFNMPVSYAEHMSIILYAPFPLLVMIMCVVGGLGYFLSRVINTNKFSQHAMYRNRLIRAYLGASNEDRVPNLFTGFDPSDNIPMHRLRPEFFHHGSFSKERGKGIWSFVRRLKVGDTGLSKFFHANLSPKTRQYLEEWDVGQHPSRVLQRNVITDLNCLVLKSDSLYDDTQEFSSVPAARALNEQYPNVTGDQLMLLNRRLIEAAFPEDIVPCPEPPHTPLHIINVALNLVQGEKLAWQDRKAASFTVSPLHCGSCQIPDFEEDDKDRKIPVYGAYRPSSLYGGSDSGGISLGTAVAISGAAVSPNMGYYSSPLVTFLMTLFNVRLGWWLGNPGKAGQEYYKKSNPKSSAYPIVAEALGQTDDENAYVYLSDGGHFENLGLYEMVLRRCQTIVVSDASDDFDFEFDGLGNAIRKIRIDFGIPIEFSRMAIYSRSSKKEDGAFCAIGHIKYSEVDHVDEHDLLDDLGDPVKDKNGKVIRTTKAPDGLLIYIKPTFYGGDEPRDVYHYAQANKRFPHESTADQWFSEEQFESYRSLGLYIVGKIWEKADAPPASIDDLRRAAIEHLRPKGTGDGKAMPQPKFVEDKFAEAKKGAPEVTEVIPDGLV